jgi:hypothetical protein
MRNVPIAEDNSSTDFAFPSAFVEPTAEWKGYKPYKSMRANTQRVHSTSGHRRRVRPRARQHRATAARRGRTRGPDGEDSGPPPPRPHETEGAA